MNNKQSIHSAVRQTFKRLVDFVTGHTNAQEEHHCSGRCKIANLSSPMRCRCGSQGDLRFDSATGKVYIKCRSCLLMTAYADTMFDAVSQWEELKKYQTGSVLPLGDK